MKENRIQYEIVSWFRNNYCLKIHNPRCIIFSVPNERSNTNELSRMMATGLLSGVSDLIVILPSRILFIECKNETGKQQNTQIDFMQSITSLGFEYHVVRSLKDFQTLINKVNNKL